jgi:hypothetical protein
VLGGDGRESVRERVCCSSVKERERMRLDLKHAEVLSTAAGAGAEAQAETGCYSQPGKWDQSLQKHAVACLA